MVFGSKYRLALRKFALACFTAGASAAMAQQTPTIGVSAPLSGPNAILGEQVSNGASAAAATLGAGIDIQDDACSAEGGATAARHFVERKVAVVVGYLCNEALEAALPILKEAGIPAITIGVRANALTDRRDKTGWPVFRLAPRGDAESAAVAKFIPQLWRTTPFAILDDGAIQNRDRAESLRLAAEEAGLKPVFVDGFRPGLDRQPTLTKRLKDAGAQAAFISGDPADAAVIAASANEAGVALEIAGGEEFAQTSPLPAGTVMVGLPTWRDVADGDTLAALDAKGVLPDGYVLPAWAGVQIAASAAKGDAATSMAERVAAFAGATAIGRVRFDAKGDLTETPYRLFRFDGRKFVPEATQ